MTSLLAYYALPWWAIAIHDQHVERIRGWCRKVLPISSAFFAPMRLMMEYRRGRFVMRRRLFYPGYVFIQCPPEALNPLMDGAPIGLFGPVRCGEAPVPVRSEEIAQVRSITGATDTAGVSYGILRGNRVEITSGPLQGREGYIVRVAKRKHRAAVLVPIGNKRVIIELTCCMQPEVAIATSAKEVA